MLVAADYGVEEAVSIDGIDKGAISKKLEELVKKGETMEKYALPTHLVANPTDFHLANAEKVASSRPVHLRIKVLSPDTAFDLRLLLGARQGTL